MILKFFLNVSKQEQKRRFLERLDSPAKRRKLSSVITERTLWSRYMQAYEQMIRATSTPTPWHVVPADQQAVHTPDGCGRVG